MKRTWTYDANDTCTCPQKGTVIAKCWGPGDHGEVPGGGGGGGGQGGATGGNGAEGVVVIELYPFELLNLVVNA